MSSALNRGAKNRRTARLGSEGAVARDQADVPSKPAQRTWHDDRIVTNVAFLLVPGVHLLDLSGSALRG